MVCEGIIALIWAAAGCAIYERSGGMMTELADFLAKTVFAEKKQRREAQKDN